MHFDQGAPWWKYGAGHFDNATGHFDHAAPWWKYGAGHFHHAKAHFPTSSRGRQK